jgi:PAS domain S-box-containing protein
MSDIFAQPSAKPPWLWAVPFVVVLAVLLLEYETPGIRVTPSLLTIALAVFALFLSPRAMFWWAVALFFPVVLTLWLIPNSGVRESVTFVALRSLAYVAVAWVAVGLSRYRWDAERRFEGLLALFDSLKTPLVVSDIDGNINFANRACCELLGREAAEIKAANFFALFSQPDQRGQSIEHYLQLFAMDPRAQQKIKVNARSGSDAKSIQATCSVLPMDGRTLLVSQLG